MGSGHFYPDTRSLLTLLHTSVTTSESTLTQEQVMSLPPTMPPSSVLQQCKNSQKSANRDDADNNNNYNNNDYDDDDDDDDDDNNRWTSPALRKSFTESAMLSVSALGRESERERESESEAVTSTAREPAAMPPMGGVGVDIAQRYGGDGSEFVHVDSFEDEMAQ
jgi:hypothetical protein